MIRTPFLILLFLSFTAVASTCKPVNLVTAPNSPFAQIPMYDQGASPSCYAFASTVLINYNTIKRGLGSIAAPLWVAVQDARNNQKQSIASSDVKSAIGNFKKQGYCSDAVVKKSIKLFSQKYNYPESEVAILLDRMAFNEQDLLALKKCDIPAIHEFLLGNPLVRAAMSSELFLKLIMPQCKPESVPALPEPQVLSDRRITSYSMNDTIIENELVNSRVPVSIGYCSNVLYDSNYPGLDYSTPRKRNSLAPLPGDCKRHASVIVGQKMVPGLGCSYLLRNSWGNGYDRSTVDKKCVCRNKKTKQYVDDCSFKTHSPKDWSVEGCWFKSMSLSKSTFSTTTLK